MENIDTLKTLRTDWSQLKNLTAYALGDLESMSRDITTCKDSGLSR